MKLAVRCLFFALFAASFTQVSGQYTYLEGAVDYSAVRFKNEANGIVSARAFSLNLTAVRRFVRPLGAGLDIGIPISRSGRTIDGSIDEFFPTGGPFRNTFDSGFSSADFKYSVKQNIIPRLLLRIYLGDGFTDFYLETRFGFSSIKEEFSVKRDPFISDEGAVVSEVDYSYEDRVKYSSIGFGIGYQNTSDDYWFFRTRAGFDVLNFQPGSFSYPLSYGFDEERGFDYIDLDSYIESTAILWHFDMGIGYYF
jgi:hypothetical protein